jgi:hypothetical protein
MPTGPPGPVVGGVRADVRRMAAVTVPEQMLVWAFVGYTAILVGRLFAARRRESGG